MIDASRKVLGPSSAAVAVDTSRRRARGGDKDPPSH
ncbi:hypothetical protein ABH937_004733 [Kitasatospora sp. GAS1066B]